MFDSRLNRCKFTCTAGEMYYRELGRGEGGGCLSPRTIDFFISTGSHHVNTLSVRYAHGFTIATTFATTYSGSSANDVCL